MGWATKLAIALLVVAFIVQVSIRELAKEPTGAASKFVVNFSDTGICIQNFETNSMESKYTLNVQMTVSCSFGLTTLSSLQKLLGMLMQKVIGALVSKVNREIR